MSWKPCSDPPERDGFYEVQCLFPDGEPLTEPEIVRWSNGEWVPSFGLQVMPHDVWREIERGEK